MSHVDSLAIDPESVSSYKLRSAVSVDFPIVTFTPTAYSHHPSSLSSTGLLELGPVFVCGSLHLLPSVVR